MFRDTLRYARTYATVGSTTVIAKPPSSPTVSHPPSVFDRLIINAAKSKLTNSGTDMSTLANSYEDHNGAVIPTSLTYESRPSVGRRVDFQSSETGIVLVAHCLKHGEDHKIAVSSGFRLNTKGRESLFVTCAHTLVEMRNSSLFSQAFTTSPESPTSPSISGSFIVTGEGDDWSLYPVSGLSSALHRSDLLILSTRGGPTVEQVKSLPLSPYPAPPQTPVRAHFVAHHPPDEPGWKPWVGGMWSKWVSGHVTGYRDFAGREALPGTYDSLSHLFFQPPPSAGSSGGPLVDEDSGAVIGLMLGSRMDSRIEGVRGWGVPSEAIYESLGSIDCG